MMLTPTLTKRIFWAAEVLLLTGTLVACAWISHPAEWHPLAVVALSFALALLGQWLSVETSAGELSASLVAIVLAMGLLGPVPAAACGASVALMRSAVGRLGPAQWLNNLVTFTVAPFVGALIVRALAGDVQSVQHQHLAQSALFGLIMLGAMIVLIVLNFALFAADVRIDEGRPFSRQIRELFLPLLPGELAAGMLATILALAYSSAGLSMLFGSIVVLLILRHLTVALLRSEDRAEQLEMRSRQLVGLQLGVLRTLVRALNMREQSTGRHAAAVARYARALAKELGSTEEELDIIHAAGLLHEIGKFTWPDRILHAEAIEDKDLSIVKDHPREGAILVGALDGYGPAADAILYHHERVDGRGYPAGLIGNEIPLTSRVLAICCTYHTMIAGQGYRSPMTAAEATEELANAARNGQLDGELVEHFTRVLEREGPALAEDADFEIELEFERRVQEMAEPRSADPLSRSSSSR
jgi:predicted Zn-dependent protease with MMP-like domain